MNRFRTKKTCRDKASNGNRPLVGVEFSRPFRMFEKRAAQGDESKMQVDLATALPSIDDFRTSLLMTGLSARFSLLREKDYPNSNLGEVSDDPPVYPRMQSGLVDFDGLQDWLHDIKVNGSLEALPLNWLDFCEPDDTASIASGIICRHKPAEGNDMFGDRQETYKLATDARGDLSGHALNDDGRAQCIFQGRRQAEKDGIIFEAQKSQDTCEAECTKVYHRRRETSSNVSFTPSAARNLIAATSNASGPSFNHITSTSRLPGPEQSVPRTQRLYEQGVNQNTQDHQSSAISQIGTLSKHCAPLPLSLIHSSAVSAFGVRDQSIVSTANAHNPPWFRRSRVDSSQMSSANSTDKYPRQEQKLSFGARPLSQPSSENERHVALSIQSGDSVKTTAIRVTTRSALQYEKSCCVQRQRQLQQGRHISLLRHPIEWTASSVQEPPRLLLAQRVPAEWCGPNSPLPEILVRDKNKARTVVDDSDDSSIDNQNATSVVDPHYTIELPDDQDYPTFRKSALLTPLSSYSSKDTDEQGALSPSNTQGSPTLGHNTGLFDMVRQHLRYDSTASSIYSFAIRETDLSRTKTSGNNYPREHDTGNAEDATTDEREEFAQHLVGRSGYLNQTVLTI